MKVLIAVLFATLMVVVSLNAFAQDEPTKGQATVDYSLVEFVPAALYTSSHTFNGGGGSVSYYFNHYIGLKADLQGYASSTLSFNVNVPAHPITGVTSGIFSVQGNMFTYLFGPVIRKPGKIEPFGEVLLGGAHTNVYTNFLTQAGVAVSGSPNAFALAAGVGLDIHLNRRFSLRPVEVDYLLTRFSNPVTDPTDHINQNSFRYVAGAAFNW